MSERRVVQNISTIIKGSLIFFISLAISYALAFISRILMARYLIPSKLGIYFLSLSFIGLFGIFSTLSISDAITRYISYYLGEKKYKRVRGIILSSFIIIIPISIIISLICFYISPVIANIYKNNEIIPILQILSFSIIFSSIIITLASIFAGFQKIRDAALFKNILFNIIKISFFIAIILSVIQTPLLFAYAYTISMIITCVMFILYSFYKIPKFIPWKWKSTNEIKTIFSFSIPLLIIAIIQNFSSQCSVLILGIFETDATIGIFSVVVTISTLFILILESIKFIYLPVFTRIFTEKKNKYEMKKIYLTISKWLIFVSFPLIVIIIFFPQSIIITLFGLEYVSGSTPLMIYSFATFIWLFNIIPSSSLIAIGKTKICMNISVISYTIGITLMVLLIPLYGIIGICFAFLFQNIILSLQLNYIYYREMKIHMFSNKMLNPILICTLIYIFFYLLKTTMKFNIYFIIICIPLILIIYLLTLLMTRSLDRIDIAIIEQFEKRLNLKKNYFSKFIKKLVK